MHKELVTPNLFKTDIATNKGKGNSESVRETPEHGTKNPTFKSKIFCQDDDFLAGKSAHQYGHLSGKPFYANRYPFQLKKDAHLR